MSTSNSNDILFNSLEAISLKTILHGEWESLIRYSETMTMALINERELFESWVDGEIKKLSTSQKRKFYADNLENFSFYSDELPRILWNSFFVSAYSLLEHHMDTICQKIKEERQVPKNVSDLRGNTLKRARLFWKVAKLDFPCDAKTWKEINDYSEVRNCIVHDNGLPNENKKNLINYANKKGIVSNETNELVITKQFCKEAVRTMQNFVDTLCEVDILCKSL